MKQQATTKTSSIQRWRLRKGDNVLVLRGRDRGRKGKVMVILPADGTVLVEGINLVKKHVRPKRQGEKGQRVSIPAPLPVSNVQLICKQCKKATRVGITRTNEQRQRVCKQCQAVID